MELSLQRIPRAKAAITKIQHSGYLIRKLFRLSAPIHSPGTHQPIVGETLLALPPETALVDLCVPGDHPLAVQWLSETLPDLKRLISSQLKAGETFKVEAWPGSVHEKLTVRISFRDPTRIRKTVEGCKFLDKRRYDVIYAKGDDLRVLASFDENLGHRNHSLWIPKLPGCASGMPIYSTQDTTPLGNAVMGGVIQVNDQLLGIATFHFLMQQPKMDNSAMDIKSDTSNDPRSGASTLPTGYRSTVGNNFSTPKAVFPRDLSGISVYLQPWPWSGSEPADEPTEPLKMEIYAASGSRLSTSPFQWHGKTVGDLRSIMDWALFVLPDSPPPPNYYLNAGNDTETGSIRRIVMPSTSSAVTHPGVRQVDIVVRGRVYCTGSTSALPCLLSSRGGSGLAFVVSTSIILDEGLSGACLVDSNTSELVGHLFAASVSSRVGYFVSVMETLRDIERTLGTNRVQMAPDKPPKSPMGVDPGLSRLSAELDPIDPPSTGFNDQALHLKQRILAFNGGGIRGYSSLLILRELMEKITFLEYEARHSNLSVGTSAPTPVIKDILPLPCHYFDYIFGTGTGGLSAIMLGRLRVDVDTCLWLYEVLGDVIFRHPRRVHINGHPLKSKWWWPWPKYNHKKLERLLQVMIQESCGPPDPDGQPNDWYPFDADQCRTVVVAIMETGTDLVPFLFRTYNNLSPGWNNGPGIRNPGKAYNARIWKVARAATAAPGLFSAMKLDGNTFLDGGLGHNNPSRLAFDEVVELHQGEVDDCPIGVLLNIGTGRPPQKAENIAPIQNMRGFRYHRYLKDSEKSITAERETVHDLLRMAKSKHHRFQYYHLEVDNEIGDMRMDEWKKDGSTLTRIRQCTNAYLSSTEVQNILNRVARQLVDARLETMHSWSAEKIKEFYEGPPQKLRR